MYQNTYLPYYLLMTPLFLIESTHSNTMIPSLYCELAKLTEFFIKLL